MIVLSVSERSDEQCGLMKNNIQFCKKIMLQQSYFPNPLKPNTRRTSDVKRRLSNIGSRSRRHSSLGSLIHPSIGIPFAISSEIHQFVLRLGSSRWNEP